jgi:AAA+ superfamily predicted ATPase
MLIDEADVYIKRREDDMTMNAVVGLFLCVLEYFNGLMFLTTNRVDDIDEAIVSRSIALIKYRAPDLEARLRIRRVMIERFSLQVDAGLVDELVKLYPDATGRDIKGLAKLVAKYCSHKAVPPSLAVVRRCSIFRAMEVAA